MAERLNDTGGRLDLALLEAAALLHDLAKGEPDHAAAGAAILQRMGYESVAGMVAVHMEAPPGSDGEIEAAELLFLADKLVQGDRFVSLATRFRPRLERHAHEPMVLANVMRRLDNALVVQQRVEARLGTPIDTLFSGAQS
jgi:hypothetical protein